MFCPSCGKEVVHSKSFCGHCGTKIEPNIQGITYKTIGLILLIVFLVILSIIFIINTNQSDIKDSGIGIYLKDACNVVVVSELMPDMPAYYAGIEKGDTILKVNNKYVFDTDTACNMIRGKRGTKLKITVLHNHKPITYKLVRKYINQ